MSNLAEDVISTISIESKDSTSSIPTSITVNMSASEQTNNSNKRKANDISLSEGTSLGNEEETDLQTLKLLLEALTKRVEALTESVDALTKSQERTDRRLNPQEDPFFDIRLVEQSASCRKRTPTWTLMKITDDGFNYKCIGVSSAHLINWKFRSKAKDSIELFIELPKSFCEAGVSAVMLHPRILDEDPNDDIDHCDLMIVELKNVPMMDSKEVLKLDEYPKTNIDYKGDWRRKLILGRSSLNFVKGECVAVESKDEKIHFEFVPDKCEKGDSGTVLYADMGNGLKEIVGLYRGYVSGKRSWGDRGIITPAIGWETLTKLDALMDTKFSMKMSLNGKENNVSASKFNAEIGGTYELKYGNGDAESLYGTIIKVSKNANLAFTSSGNCDIGVSDDEDGYYDTEY